MIILGLICLFVAYNLLFDEMYVDSLLMVGGGAICGVVLSLIRAAYDSAE